MNDQIQSLKEENLKLLQQKPTDEYKSLDEAKQQIATEFSKLTEKHNIIESNMQILMQKEMEIMKKEEMNQILSSYNNIFNTSIYQITVDTRFLDSESYRFNLEEALDRVKSLELISYNVPINKYNITKFNNNLKYMIENEEKEFFVDVGIYTIDTLIEKLNSITQDLEFSLNFQEKVTIKSKEDKEVDFTMSNMLYKVLGFDRKSDLTNKKEYTSDKVYDLRTETYINLNITNIESSKEFCTLNLVSNRSVKKMEFKDPIRIEYLDISFTTYDNNPISFNDRYHTLTF